MKERIQRFGKSLSSMVMPNIGAFIAWGFITALFIPTGWCPNESLGQLVDPMLRYLLPLLIAITAGRRVAGDRGGVIAAVAVMGVIMGSDVPMFIGAMAIGPFAGWVIRTFDRWTENRIPAGFEMLVNNFPAWLSTGLNVAAGMLPAMGFAILLHYLPIKKYLFTQIFVSSSFRNT